MIPFKMILLPFLLVMVTLFQLADKSNANVTQRLWTQSNSTASFYKYVGNKLLKELKFEGQKYQPNQILKIREIALRAIYDASKVCKEIFRYERWNCSDFEDNLFDYGKNTLES
ncbi:hypothetical protein TrispH2_000143 [Trichoplax sp. H2]|nr:hypothetical protein TrispH2_000143 [Trichoplax sp. H2]|eukprot:RDD47240.1 hypothetical protein TrispH2_000143 [Trichoplax sp. H2]